MGFKVCFSNNKEKKTYFFDIFRTKKEAEKSLKESSLRHKWIVPVKIGKCEVCGDIEELDTLKEITAGLCLRCDKVRG